MAEKGRDGRAGVGKRQDFDVVIVRKLEYVTAPRKTAPSDSQRGKKRSEEREE